MNIEILDKTYFAEITIPQSSTASQFFFPTINNLDGKFTQGLSSYGVVAMPKAVSQIPVINAALFKACFVNLFVGDLNQYANLPLIDLVTIRNSLSTSGVHYNPFAMEFNNVQIIWAKSYVLINDISLISAAQNEVIPFTIKYTDGIINKEF